MIERYKIRWMIERMIETIPVGGFLVTGSTSAILSPPPMPRLFARAHTDEVLEAYFIEQTGTLMDLF